MPRKRIHWTHRPENKEKLKAMSRKAAQTRKNGKTTAQDTDAIPEATFAYALGHIECWVDTFAKSAGVPPAALAAQLGAILSRKSRG